MDMLFLLFNIATDAYAIPADRVREVIPNVPLRACPAAPAYIAGLLNYHGKITPVVDLCRLLTPSGCAPALSTRIMLVTYTARDGRERLLGLAAETVTNMLEKREADFSERGIVNTEAPFLGAIACENGQTLQCIHVERMLPAEIEALLFNETGEDVR